MRRAPLVVTLVLALALGLAGCSGDSSDGSSPSASGSAAPSAQSSAAALASLSQIKVTGALGKQPTIVAPPLPYTVTTFVAALVQDGTGKALAKGDGLKVHQEVISGADGKAVGSTWTGEPQSGLVVGHNSGLGELDSILENAHVGARILIAYPSTGSSSTSTSSPVTYITVLDVMDTYTVLTRATGTPVAPVAGLPTVTLKSTGEPELTAATGTAPTTLVVQPLIKGAGPTVTKGQTLTVHYSGWLWNGTAFDSSWTRGTPFSVSDIGAGSVIAGWNEGLVGQTVGSQVLMVVPPDKGYGSTAEGSIPANSTLVFVIDILAAS